MHQHKDGLESLSTQVRDDWQGKGIATNMYAVMRMLGVNINPATMQSDDGKKMWSKWNKQGDAQHIKSMNAKMSEGISGAKYKVRSIGHDAKGDYYISPNTGKKVYKKGVKVGDHENPKTGEHKSVAEGDSPAMAHTAKSLTTSPKVMQHRAKRDQERDKQLQYRNISKRDEELDEKIKGADGKACWPGYRYNGTENGSDKCVKIGEAWELEMSSAISKLFENR
jgi:hypothetical protein